jgi:hypothetical protein
VVAIVTLRKGLLSVLRFSLVSTIPFSLLRHETFTTYYVKDPVFQRRYNIENSGTFSISTLLFEKMSDHVRDNATERSVY